MVKFYVSPFGNDKNEGTEEFPFFSIEKAIEKTGRQMNERKDDGTVILKDGYYYPEKTLLLTAESNPADGATLKICAEHEGKAVISGGRRVVDWEKVVLNGKNMFRAKLPEVTHTRIFTVNGSARNLASIFKSKTERKGWGWIPHTDYSSFEVRFADIPEIHNVEQLEVVWIAEWKTFIYRAEKIAGNILTMKQPFFSRMTSIVKLSGVITEHDINGYWWPNPARHPLFLQNDISFISERGDFCFDEKEHYLYYYPYLGEDLEKCVCEIAETDEIIKIAGKDGTIPQRVKNIVFEGLVIENGDFRMLTEEGIGVNQSQSYYCGIAKLGKNGNMEIPYNQYTANINVDYAENIVFSRCHIRNTAKGGIYFHDGVTNGRIEGCVFEHIGDTAIIVGDGMHGFYDENHITENIVISNNLIKGVSKVIDSAPAIQAYFVKGIKIVCNDVYDCGQSGINVGWGWTVCLDSHITQNVLIERNRVGNFGNKVHDCGGIYTLGQAPGSVCRYNYVYEQLSAFGALYHDEGTAGYETYGNVVNSDLLKTDREVCWLTLNGFPNGPNGIQSVYDTRVYNNWHNNKREDCERRDKASCSVENNFYFEGDNVPYDALKIINDSGLSDEYAYIFNKLNR